MSPKSVTDGCDRRFNDVLRRRFLRQVRFKERRRRRTSGGSPRKLVFSELNNENELEHLKAAIDFLVELCGTVSPKEDVNFANWSHQAVDFILGTLKISLTTAKNIECLEGYISSLVTRLVKRMCAPENESSHSSMDSQFCVQHLIRKLGSESFIGQRAILSVSQTISVLAESLLFTDPFDAAFHHRHECMFIMIQLIEFLISDYLSMWSKNEDFDKMLFEEWVVSILHARKALELLENRNGLYVLYIDRVAAHQDVLDTNEHDHHHVTQNISSLNPNYDHDHHKLKAYIRRGGGGGGGSTGGSSGGSTGGSSGGSRGGGGSSGGSSGGRGGGGGGGTGTGSKGGGASGGSRGTSGGGRAGGNTGSNGRTGFGTGGRGSGFPSGGVSGGGGGGRGFGTGTRGSSSSATAIGGKRPNSGLFIHVLSSMALILGVVLF